MHILLACAKIMRHSGSLIPEGVALTTPAYGDIAAGLAASMTAYTPAELARIFKCSDKIARQAYADYRDFGNPDSSGAAAVVYDGAAFKELGFATLPADAMEWSNSRLTICSFMYGLLRPLDRISPYRMEGGVRLPATADEPVMRWWQTRLTDDLIGRVRQSGGTLLNLASKEMTGLFDWDRVMRSVKVVTPQFAMALYGGSLRVSSVYSKMCRGAMSRYVIENRIDRPGGIAGFDRFGFVTQDEPDCGDPMFVARL